MLLLALRVQIGWKKSFDVYSKETLAMPILLAVETAASEVSPMLLNASIAIGSLVIGWFLKVLSDSISQETLFDHRLRLEKEYGLYSEMWDKLFDLRRAIGQLVEPLGSTADVRHDNDLLPIFNAYQSAVRKGEPFMRPSIYDPARKIAHLARQIISDTGKQGEIEKRRKGNVGTSEDEKPADQQISLDNRADLAFKDIEQLFQQVAKAIRQRVCL